MWSPKDVEALYGPLVDRITDWTTSDAKRLASEVRFIRDVLYQQGERLCPCDLTWWGEFRAFEFRVHVVYDVRD